MQILRFIKIADHRRATVLRFIKIADHRRATVLRFIKIADHRRIIVWAVVMAKPAISFIIPAKNEAESLANLLKDIGNQTVKDVEILVIDGGSTDGTEKTAKKYGAKFIPEYGKYRSPANAKNIGIEKAKSDILVLYDADVQIPDKRFVENILKIMEDKKIGGIMPFFSAGKDTWVERAVEASTQLRTNLAVALDPMKAPMHPHIIRRDILKKIEFDPSLGIGEDKIMADKVRQNKGNYKFIFSKECKSLVHHPHTLAELYAQQRWYGKTVFYYLRKNPSFSGFASLLKLTFFFIPAALFLLPLSTLLSTVLTFLSLPFIYFEIDAIVKCATRGVLKYAPEIVLMDVVKSAGFAHGLLRFVFGSRAQRGH